RLQATWRSPVYGLYNKKVTIGYENDRKYHYFQCSNTKCKLGGVRRYLDKNDRAATGNLITHAKSCRGEDAVEAVMSSKSSKSRTTRDGTIYAAFARLGQKVRSFSSRPHTAQETRANIVRWITENNRPAKIVTDPGFQTLMKTGRPSTSLPSPRQVGRDVRQSFVNCKARMATLLQEYPGTLAISTDAWTSPNHRAIIAWVVHLEHEGRPLSFLLDVKELPTSHTGEALAKAL
ncbi:hypothetical protein B0H12DRAFT_981291, partial [Mycena haematopus]